MKDFIVIIAFIVLGAFIALLIIGDDDSLKSSSRSLMERQISALSD